MGPRWTLTPVGGTSAIRMVLFSELLIASERSKPTFLASTSNAATNSTSRDVVVTEHDVHQAGDGARRVGVLVVLDALDQGAGAVAHSHDRYSYRSHGFSSLTPGAGCRVWLACWPASCLAGAGRAGVVLPSVPVPLGVGSGPLGGDQVGEPAHLALDGLDGVPLELADVTVGARGPRLLRARSSRSWSRDRRPSRMRRRTSESVREKNANLMLKSSSSQAEGPTSVILPAKYSVPAGVIW